MEPAPAPARSLGGRLAQARRFAGLKQSEAAAKVGASRKTIYNWEHDDTSPTVGQLVRWARATGFPVAWFIEGIDDDSITVGYPMGNLAHAFAA